MFVKFDREYATSYKKEVAWLKENNIDYTFVKSINGISTYKFTKSPELFHALEIFYCQNI